MCARGVADRVDRSHHREDEGEPYAEWPPSGPTPPPETPFTMTAPGPAKTGRNVPTELCHEAPYPTVGGSPSAGPPPAAPGLPRRVFRSIGIVGEPLNPSGVA